MKQYFKKPYIFIVRFGTQLSNKQKSDILDVIRPYMKRKVMYIKTIDNATEMHLICGSRRQINKMAKVIENYDSTLNYAIEKVMLMKYKE